MGSIPHAVLTFSHALLEQQGTAAADADPDKDVAALERCLHELGAFLRALVGVEGYRALVVRALHVAANDYPALQAIEVQSDPPGLLIGLRQALHQTPSPTREQVVAILAGLVWLLTTFVGEDLTMRLLREVWPALPELSSLACESN